MRKLGGTWVSVLTFEIDFPLGREEIRINIFKSRFQSVIINKPNTILLGKSVALGVVCTGLIYSSYERLSFKKSKID